MNIIQILLGLLKSKTGKAMGVAPFLAGAIIAVLKNYGVEVGAEEAGLIAGGVVALVGMVMRIITKEPLSAKTQKPE